MSPEVNDHDDDHGATPDAEPERSGLDDDTNGSAAAAAEAESSPAAPVTPSDLDPAAHDSASAESEPGSLPHDGLDDADEAVADGRAEPTGADVLAERDEYLEALRRVKAEFDNYKKRTERERLAVVDRAAEGLVLDLLPVLDACEAAVAHGDDGAAQIQTLLMEVLGKGGLEAMAPIGEPFDPTLHEAVLREDGEGPSDSVLDVLRSGYTWRGRVLRPAMVKVQT